MKTYKPSFKSIKPLKRDSKSMDYRQYKRIIHLTNIQSRMNKPIIYNQMDDSQSQIYIDFKNTVKQDD